jgi:SET domain-containing protein
VRPRRGSAYRTELGGSPCLNRFPLTRKSHSSKGETQTTNVSELKSAKMNQRAPYRQTRESGYPEVFDFPLFRVALARIIHGQRKNEEHCVDRGVSLEERRHRDEKLQSRLWCLTRRQLARNDAPRKIQV